MDSSPKIHKDDAKANEFMKLMVPNQRRILSFIAHLVPQKNDAEDIYQETLAEMWKKFDEFLPGTDFDKWGITIARFKIFNFRRKTSKSKVHFSEDVIEIIQKESDKQSRYIDDCLDVLQRCVKKLSGRQLQYLRMHYEEGLSCRKIASQIGITHQAISKTMNRIHAALVKCVRLTLGQEASHDS